MPRTRTPRRTVQKQSVRDLDVAGKRVLVRADLNVPLADGAVSDDTRIRGSLPTIQDILERGGEVVLCSHLGRPNGARNDAFSLAPVADRLQALLGRPVTMAPDCVGPAVQALAGALEAGQILLLENLRFHPGEEANDGAFAKQLARLADLYVNDAFGAAHRAHASTEGVAQHLPAAAGLLLEAEIAHLAGLFGPDSGRVAVISGGAKVSDKIALLENLVRNAAVLCIGGAMANTFLLAQGVPVGTSLVERDRVDDAARILALAAKRKCEVILPVDAVIARGPEHPPRARPLLFAEETVPDDWMILDVGPRTIEEYAVALETVETIVWNGPVGLFEREAFSGGSRALAMVLADLEGARTIICGGDTVAAVNRAGVAKRMTFMSTGGGAALELLEGRTLPGIAALPDA